nr:hypothetical protein [Kibdelosporangium sp. MJ126-NF4]
MIAARDVDQPTCHKLAQVRIIGLVQPPRIRPRLLPLCSDYSHSSSRLRK